MPIDRRGADLVGEDFARGHRLIPLSLEQDTFLVAVADFRDTDSIESLRRLSGRPVSPVVSTWPEIELALDAAFRPEAVNGTLWRNLSLLLLDIGFINRDQYSEISRLQDVESRPFDRFLVEESYLDEARVAEAKSLLFSLPWVHVENTRVNARLVPIVPQSLAQRLSIVPLFADGRALVVTGPGPVTGDGLRELVGITGLPVRQTICTWTAFREAFQEAYGQSVSQMKARPLSFDEALLKRGIIGATELHQAHSVSQATGESVESLLLRLGRLDEDRILDVRAFQLSVQGVRLRARSLPKTLASLLPEACSRRYRCLPFADRNNIVFMAMVDPLDAEAIQVISEVTGKAIRPFLCFEDDLDSALERIYGGARASGPGPTCADAGRAYADGHLGRLTQRDLIKNADLQLALPWIHLDQYKLKTETVLMIREEDAREHCLIAVYRQDSILTVAVGDPRDDAGIALVERTTGLAVKVVAASRESISHAIDDHYAAASIDVAPEVRGFTDFLVQQGALPQDQVRDVWTSTALGVPIDLAVLNTGTLSDEQVAIALAQHLHLEYLDLSAVTESIPVVDAVGRPVQRRRQVDPVDRKIARLIGAEAATAIAAVPIAMSNNSADHIKVAFANPLDAAAIEAIKKLSRPFLPVVSTREQILDAIRRSLGKTSIGDYLVKAGIITAKQQNEALQLHRKTGVRMGKALTSLGYITDEQLVTLLARQQEIAFYDLEAMAVDHDLVRMLPPEFEREHRLIPIEKDEHSIIIAIVDSPDKVIIQEVEQMTHLLVNPVLITEDSFNRVMEEVYRKDYLHRSATELMFRYPDESAMQVLSSAQAVSALLVLAASALLVAWNYLLYFLILNSLTTLFYVSSSIYKLYLIYRSLAHTLEIPISEEEVASLDERDLPVYSILIPLYRESSVVPKLIRAIDDLDYPKAKLDVKILLEEDDTETIHAIRQYSLPAHFKIVVVPDGTPKGKPKACNYGLIHAEGKYVVVFDAEDIPEPDQLKKAILAFRRADESVVCIQAKLNYYNRDQNLLTRWFTAEYSMWFDLLLPGLDADGVPIPLGGTSNHFPTSILQELGAWDPHNVTEDADLGMRLYKAGWKTAVIDSTTYEEANSQIYNWIRQRSRWVKGYIQTYLVHMRHPLRLWRYIGTKAFFSFNMVVGGTFLSFLLNPLYWSLTAIWFLSHWAFIRELYPPFIFYVGGFGLYIGNFVFTYINVAGCLKRGYYDMVKYALLTPIYWALMSVAAWKGFIQLFYKPSYWEKTVHGLYKGEAMTAPSSSWKDLFFRRARS